LYTGNLHVEQSNENKHGEQKSKEKSSPNYKGELYKIEMIDDPEKSTKCVIIK